MASVLVAAPAGFYGSSLVGKHHSCLFVLEPDHKSLSGQLTLTLEEKQKKWQEAFSVRSIKYHFIFMKVAAGFCAGCLFFGVGCNEMFAHSLTFPSQKSKSTNLNALINFITAVCGLLSLKRTRARRVRPNRLVNDAPRSGG